MLKRGMGTRSVFRALSAILGMALLAYLIWRVGPGKLLENASALGWGLALIIILGGVSHVIKTWAWRLTLPCKGESVSFLHMLKLRLVSEAIGQVGALGTVFGEGLRIAALSPQIPIERRVSSVTLDRALFIATGAILSVVGIVAALVFLPLTHAFRLYGVFLAFTLIVPLFAAALLMLNQWPILSRSARAFGRVRCFRDRVQKALPLIDSVERNIFEFHRDSPGAFWGCVALNLVCHGMAVLEVYLVLWFLGARISVLGALVTETLTKVINAAGAAIPGNLGIYEGGNILIAGMFGMSSAMGLALALSRRLRAIFWAAVGGLCPILTSRSNKKRDTGMQGNKTARPTSGRQTDAITAVIFANNGGEANKPGSSLFEVGTLPILLRDVIALERAGAGRIIACVDPISGWRVRQALLETGRLPRSIEWREVHSATPPSSLLGQIASEPGTDLLILVAGDTAYQPALFRQASEWTRKDSALVLTSDGEPIGISAFSAGFALDVAQSCPSQVHTLHELHEWLVSSKSARSESVQEESWQRVLTAEDGAAAERKLDRWLVKPTDGIFARMNRRVSVPISRQLIKFPITPNMVSVGTLGVGVASGFFFACGGYWNMLFGAVLSIAASILDGCDGEVARLKLMESAFGCWLETVCDYLYYLLVFAGMAIGLSRTYGSKAYLVWGAVLLVGAVTSFLVAGMGRHRLAAEHPEQFLKIWQAKAESRQSNPIFYIARNTEFIIRRCFLPYALFSFALLNITRVAFIMSAVGANLVWMISLYSYCAFVVAGKSYLKSSAVSA